MPSVRGKSVTKQKTECQLLCFRIATGRTADWLHLLGLIEASNAIMADRPKILLLDDDQDLLDLYKEILSQLPTRPEIFTSSNGPRAIAMMESEPFTLLVCDLN